MEIFGLSVKGVIRPNVRVLLIPAILAGSLTIISLVAIKNSYTRISAEISKLQEAERTENILQEKVNLLTEMSPLLISQTDQTVVALPDKNPSIVMLIQLNLLAEKYSLVFLNKEAGSPSELSGSLSRTPISFSLEGEMSQLISFVKEISSLAPLSTVDEMRTSKALEEGYNMSIKMSVYFSEFPEKIPPLTEPVKTLNSDEQRTLDIVQKLKKPEIVEVTTTRPEKREDPFNWE
jgi:Tfp pilus assembly protein PilO